jgi:hypothetical protein
MTEPSSSSSGPSAARGPLLLADISGYTSFLQEVAYAHRDDAFADGAVPDAYAVMSSLLGGIVERVVPPFTLAKLEGDAVFAYAVDMPSVPRGADMRDCLAACYADFRGRLREASELTTCWCDVCSRIEVLDLKFILHAGPFVSQQIAGQRELVGPEVVVAHRLLKSRAPDLIGDRAYALVTDAACATLDIPVDGSVELAESFDDHRVSARVFALREG